MFKISLRRSFSVAMKSGWILGLILLISFKSFSQEKTVSGIVFDRESHDRIASISIHNITTGASIYNNLKGEFKIAAKAGDKLVFSRLEFISDTIKLHDDTPLAVYMTRKAIQLNEVTVHDSLLTPEQRLEATKREYSKIYGSLAYDGWITSPSSGGAGLSIDALWNALSRSGRNASHLRETIQHDYEQNFIDYRFNRTYVSNITGLKDERLTAFMTRYRPGYYVAKYYNEYEFVSMIRANYRRFLRTPNRRYTLPPLITK